MDLTGWAISWPKNPNVSHVVYFTAFRDIKIVVIIFGINGMCLDMWLFIFVLENWSIEKLILGNRQVCKPEEGSLDSAPVYKVIMHPTKFPGNRRRWDNI